MGLLDFFKSSDTHEAELAKAGFEISSCSQECDSCTSSFPSSLKLSDGSDDDLWGTTKPYGLHIVIPTNKSDWPHDAVSGSGSFAKKVDAWASKSKINFGALDDIKVTVSSLSSLELERDPRYMNGNTGDVLLLPFFIWIKNLEVGEVDEALGTIVPKLVLFRNERLTKLPSDLNTNFPKLTIETDPNLAYIFLCSHRTRDKKCGITAPIMKREMDMYLRELGLYRDFGDDRDGGVSVSFVNHIGGHKYAANVIIYLKKSGKNIWLARCKPNNVIPIIDECVVNNGRVWPEKIRQVQKFQPVDW